MISEKIDVFLKVGRELSFSAVAKKRYTTQPTISRQIADLEFDWGVKLFERSNRGLRLTPEGAIMLNCCKKMEQLIDVALGQTRELKASKRDALNIGILTEIDADRLLIPAIEGLSERCKDLDITLSFESFGDLRKGLHADRYDVIFTYDFDLVNINDDVVADHIKDLKPCMVISKRHFLYGKDKLSISDLKDEVFFLPEEKDSPGRERDLLYILHAYHISEGKIKYVPNQESALLQARLGKGVALLSTEAVQIEEYGLRVINFERNSSVENMALVAVWKRENLNPFVAMFMGRLHLKRS